MEQKKDKIIFIIGIFSLVVAILTIFLSTTVGTVLFLNGQKEASSGYKLEQQLLFYSPYAGSVIALYPNLWSADGEMNGEMNSKDYSELEAAEILITKEGFEPKKIIIKVNQPLIWKNEQDRLSALVLGVREIYGVNSGLLEPGQKFEQGFSKPGVYTYVDGIVLGRVGKIVVQ